MPNPRTLGSIAASTTMPRNRFSAMVDPTALDDDSQGYAAGSVWINVNAPLKLLWTCTDATLSGAIWHPFGLVFPLSNFTAIVDPTTHDDSTLGYSNGSVWIDTVVPAKVFVCVNPQASGAVWKPLGLIFPLSNFAAPVPPTANDDSTHGYSAGSQWLVNGGSNKLFICFSAVVGAAVWREILTHP